MFPNSDPAQGAPCGTPRTPHRVRHSQPTVGICRHIYSPSVSYCVDFVDVSTVGLESSPVVAALAGLRANEARYFKNKYDHVFTVEPAVKAKKDIELVDRILKEEREIVIASPPLEATAFQVDNIRWTYVFYESGLSINVLYTLDGPDPKRAVGFKLSEGMDVPSELSSFKFAAPEVKAGRDHPRLVLRDQGPVLSRGASDPRSWCTHIPGSERGHGRYVGAGPTLERQRLRDWDCGGRSPVDQRAVSVLVCTLETLPMGKSDYRPGGCRGSGSRRLGGVGESQATDLTPSRQRTGIAKCPDARGLVSPRVSRAQQWSSAG